MVEDFDLDLFFVPCCGGPMMHFASAGASAMALETRSASHAEVRRSLLRIPSRLRLDYKLSSDLDSILSEKRSMDGIVSQRQYCRDFVEYAKRGCYSFDRTKVNDPSDGAYHLVAFPFDEHLEEFYEKTLPDVKLSGLAGGLRRPLSEFWYKILRERTSISVKFVASGGQNGLMGDSSRLGASALRPRELYAVVDSPFLPCNILVEAGRYRV